MTDDAPDNAYRVKLTAGTVNLTWNPQDAVAFISLWPQDPSKDTTLQSSTTTWNYTASQDEDLYFAVFRPGSGILITTVDPPTKDQNTGIITTTATCVGEAFLTFTNTPAPAAPVLQTLTGLTIIFFTGAENKDPSTEITATLTKSDGTLVAQYGQSLIDTAPGTPGFEAPSEFPAGIPTSKQMALQKSTFTNSDTTGLTLTITITPHGSGPIPIAHDTWTFTWQLAPEWNHVAGTAVTAPAYWSLDENKRTFSSPDPITLA
jgi:hypothetical protein